MIKPSAWPDFEFALGDEVRTLDLVSGTDFAVIEAIKPWLLQCDILYLDGGIRSGCALRKVEPAVSTVLMRARWRAKERQRK